MGRLLVRLGLLLAGLVLLGAGLRDLAVVAVVPGLVAAGVAGVALGPVVLRLAVVRVLAGVELTVTI